jgi:alpha-ribazole phosphatase
MVTKIYLIRHGETEGAETKRYKGHIDVPLSGNGIRQMERVAEYISAKVRKRGSAEVTVRRAVPLQNVNDSGLLSAVYCSDLSRAVKSAEIIAAPHGLKPVVMTELRERNFGAWEGMTFDEIRERWPDEFKAWARNPLAFSPIRGESTIEVKSRALKAFKAITEERPNGDIAIISHGGVNRVLLCELLGMPLENIFRIEQNFGCLNMIELWDDYPVVKLINFTV